MSLEIINLFTSSKNIEYLKHYFEKNILDINAKNIILDNLTEDVFNFPSNELLNDNRSNLRHSTDVWKEVRNLNQKFIENRIAFANQIKDIGVEDYAKEMFISDSLCPKSYETLNEDIYDKKRIFRYQDPYDSNRSAIPIYQISGHNVLVGQESSDELRDSYLNQSRSANKNIEIDHIFNMPSIDEKKYKWFEL